MTTIEYFPDIVSLWRAKGFSISSLGMLVRGEIKSHRGYVISEKEEATIEFVSPDKTVHCLHPETPTESKNIMNAETVTIEYECPWADVRANTPAQFSPCPLPGMSHLFLRETVQEQAFDGKAHLRLTYKKP
jgi:hypothetical protein